MSSLLPSVQPVRPQRHLPWRGPLRGAAEWQVRVVDGKSSVTRSQACTPLALLVSRPRGTGCWGFLASHGGGLVSGDTVTVRADIGPDAAAYLGSQGLGKVYRGLAQESCSQDIALTVAPRGLGIWAPDPLACFAHARYRQTLTIALTEDASAVVVDALHAGRAARGERWQAQVIDCRMQLLVDGSQRLVDRLLLTTGRSLERLRGWTCLATLLLLGPRALVTAQAAAALLPAPARQGDLLASFHPCAGGHLLRVATRTSAQLLELLARILAPLMPALGGAPWLRRP